MAIGGSTNAVIHCCAIAHEIQIAPEEIMNDFDRISNEIPLIAKVSPATNEKDCEDLYRAGGIPKVFLELGSKINRDVMTVDGKTLGEALDGFTPLFPEDKTVIHSMQNPFSTLGGLAIMRGNLAPDTGVAKPAAIAEEVRRFEGTAVCFDGEAACIEAIEKQQIKPGHVVVIRYEGPKGGPGMREMYLTLKMLNGQGLAKSTAVITDGRFSGTNNGCFVGHISPEAADGGPIAIVKDGDRISIDVYEKKIELLISEEEMEKRLKEWKYTPKEDVGGYLSRYAKLVSSASRGAVLD
jgi:dihydroxy-acid dehydratase